MSSAMQASPAFGRLTATGSQAKTRCTCERTRDAGVGCALLVELLERAHRLQKHCLVAGIEAGNAASIGLHESLGFRQVGPLPEVGCKFGRWLDLALLVLNPSTEGQQPVPASAVV